MRLGTQQPLDRTIGEGLIRAQNLAEDRGFEPLRAFTQHAFQF